jgi:hypothetical protein
MSFLLSFSGSFIFCVHHEILLGRSNQGEWGGRDMWHAWERGETYTGFWWESPKEKRPLGRSKCRWEDGIKMDVRVIGLGGVECIHLAQDRDRWRAVVNAVMNLRVLAPRSYCHYYIGWFCDHFVLRNIIRRVSDFLGRCKHFQVLLRRKCL